MLKIINKLAYIKLPEINQQSPFPLEGRTRLMYKFGEWEEKIGWI